MDDSAPAEPGSVLPLTVQYAIGIRAFYRRREAVLSTLFRQTLRPSILRESILQEVLIEFVAGRTHSIRHYQSHLASLGSPTAVRAEIRTLSDLAVLHLERGAARQVRVCPTVRMVTFYNEQSAEMSKTWPFHIHNNMEGSTT